MWFARPFQHRITSGAHLLASLWFAGVACAVFWRVVFRGEVLYYGDIMLYFHPMLSFENYWLSRGILPLWNPHTLFGQPFVGNPQESLLYPSTLVVAWLGAERAISWGAVAHLWLAGLGVYAFAFCRGYPFRSAVAAGTLWMLCGAVVLRSQHVGILQTLAWYGCGLWAVERLLQQATMHRAVVLTAVLALASLAGSPQMGYMLVLLLLAWTAYRWREVSNRRNVLRWASVAVVIALLIGGAHWLPLAELLRHTERDQLPLPSSLEYALNPGFLSLLLTPDLFGFPWRGDYALPLFYWEIACFAGTVPVVVVLIRWRTARGEERFWKWTTILSLWMALGPYGGLYLLAYYLVPGMQSFRTPLRWTAITDLALCLWAASAVAHAQPHRRWWLLPTMIAVLAAGAQLFGDSLVRLLIPHAETVAKVLPAIPVGVAALWRGAIVCAAAVSIISLHGQWRWVLASAVTLAELLWIAVPANPTCSREIFSQPPAVEPLRQTAQRLFVPDTMPIWLRYVNAHDYGSNDTATLIRWRNTLASNIGMAHGLSEASGYEPVPLSASIRLYADLAAVWQTDRYALHRAGVGAVAVGDSADNWRIISLEAPGARAWMRTNQRPVPWNMPTPQKVVLFPAQQGDMVLADSAYPGWQAWVDGKRTHWRVHDGLFRVVTVPPQARRVEWRYAPDTFRVGLYLTCIGVTYLAALASYAFARRLLPDSSP